MRAAFGNWFDEAAEWVAWAWNETSNCTDALLEMSKEVTSVALALLVTITLAPVLVHLAPTLLLVVLGAPLWFAVAFCFGQ